MDQFGVGGKAAEFAGGAVVQAGTDDQQQVALVDGLVGGPGAMHAQHAEVVGVVFAGVANALQRDNRRQG